MSSEKKPNKSKAEEENSEASNGAAKEINEIKSDSFTKNNSSFETLYKNSDQKSTLEAPKSKTDNDSLETGSGPDVVSGGSTSDSLKSAPEAEASEADLRSAMKSQASAPVAAGSTDLRSAMQSQKSTDLRSAMKSGSAIKSQNSAPIATGSTDLRSAMKSGSAIKSQNSAPIATGSTDLRSAMKSGSAIKSQNSAPIATGSTDLRSAMKSGSALKSSSGIRSPTSAPGSALRTGSGIKSQTGSTLKTASGIKSKTGSTIQRSDSGIKSANSMKVEEDETDVRSAMTASNPSLDLEDPAAQNRIVDVTTQETTTMLIPGSAMHSKSLANQTHSLLTTGPKPGDEVVQMAVLVTSNDAKSRKFVTKLFRDKDAPRILGLLSFDHNSQNTVQEQWHEAFQAKRILPMAFPSEHPMTIDNQGQISSSANIHLGPPLQELANTDNVTAPSDTSSLSFGSRSTSRKGRKSAKKRNGSGARRGTRKRRRN